MIGPVLHQHGPISQWTKRDALLLLDADRPSITRRPLVQATWSLWRKTPAAIDFVGRWLAACTEPRILTDIPNTLGQPNYPDFQDHRHDQSILSLLAYRAGAEVLDLEATGIFGAMALRPGAEMTHRFLKAPRNAERLLRGENAWLAFATAIATRAITKRFRWGRPK